MRRVLVAGIVAVGLLWAPGADARTFEVTRVADSTPNGCATGGCTLREAVIAANNRAGADTVVLKSRKTYALTIPGTGEDQSLDGSLDVHSKLAVGTTGRGRATIVTEPTSNETTFITTAPLAVTNLRLSGDGAGLLSLPGAPLRLSNSRITSGGDGVVQQGAGGVTLFRTVLTGTDGITETDDGSVTMLRSRVVGGGNSGLVETGVGNVTLTRSKTNGNDNGGVVETEAGRVTMTRSQSNGNMNTGLVETGGGNVTLTRTRTNGNDNGGIVEIEGGRVTMTRSNSNGNVNAGLVETDDGNVGVIRSALNNNGNGGIVETGGGTLSMIRSQASDNGNGGGIETGLGSASLLRSQVVRNDNGGFIEQTSGSFLVSRSRIARNGGLGLLEGDDGGLQVARSTVELTTGEGIITAGAGGLVLDRALVRRNQAGVIVGSEGASRIKRSSITRNSSPDSGGGISHVGSGTLQVTASTIDHNDADDDGGGIYANGPLVVSNSTVASNRAGAGGGIFIDGGIGSRLNAVSVVRNIADDDYGGGLYLANDAPLRVDNSLIALNQATCLGCGSPDCINEQDPFTSGGGNLLSTKDNCSGFDLPSDLERPNPRIGSLRDNGGPTKTVALKRRSPAIGKAGNDAPSRDQRGRKRGRNPDIGAFER